jgi:hypothetical protein
MGTGWAKPLGEVLTPEMAGSALVDLVRADAATTAPGYVLTAAGLQKLPSRMTGRKVALTAIKRDLREQRQIQPSRSVPQALVLMFHLRERAFHSPLA